MGDPTCFPRSIITNNTKLRTVDVTLPKIVSFSSPETIVDSSLPETIVNGVSYDVLHEDPAIGEIQPFFIPWIE